MRAPLQWQYSRNRRRHWVDDGEKYGPQFRDLFEITDNAPYGAVHRREHGYRLLFKGKHADAHKTVKTLKVSAQHLADRKL